jgi:6-pyruvoyltetrahydropterin/6-carboxytetrahydropterin synthase
MKITTKLHLYKENFKFSSAHFLIFNEQHAEMLHGHNYQVRLDMSFKDSFKGVQAQDQSMGYMIDFNDIKKYVKAKLDLWDEHVLLPSLNPDIKTTLKDKTLQLVFRDRFYAFPKNEVILLPVVNTSVECLSELLAQDFYNKFVSSGLAQVTVYVEETRGQGASTSCGESS